MKKALIALAMIVSFTIPAATAHAYPISFGPLSQSLIEQIGCAWPPEPQARCRYGYRWDPDRHGGGSCEPCRDRHQGSRYRDWDDRYNEPRRYRDYGDYGSRRYREYDDDRYYQPRRY